jgi:hypothetical protein
MTRFFQKFSRLSVPPKSVVKFTLRPSSLFLPLLLFPEKMASFCKRPTEPLAVSTLWVLFEKNPELFHFAIQRGAT